ncbi:MAG TPA: UbiD family decarboxylase [Methylomirabilota bacterium]|nr:UbiD family decarboxylase [Methylomirabilota bacterium]
MSLRDLTGWLEGADALGEVKTVKGADWDIEIGAITELAQHRENGPAVLFDEVKGYPAGYRILVNSLGSLKRTALTLGLDTNVTSPMLLVQAWRQHSKKIMPIPAKLVDSGPVMEHVETGSAVNVLEFPTPKWHEHDGGRYIGTGSVDITRDPEEGWVNLGCYRVMIHDERTVGFYISPGKHGRIHREKWFASGKPMKVAVSLGHDPLVFLAGSIEVPYGVSEYDWIGGVLGEPFEVIQGPETGLPLPANAEIVIEGTAYPDRQVPEGPFGEWTGYYASDTRPEPTIEVERVMYRSNPIMLGSPPGKPPSELTAYRAVMRSALIWDEMEKAGIPDIQGVWCHPAGGTRLLVVVSIKQRYAGHARQAALGAMSCRAGAYLGRYVVVVDDDIDPTNTWDVLWAICTRSDPEKDIDIVRRMWSGPLDPIIPAGQKGLNSRALIDATRPYEWKDKFPRVAISSKAVIEAAREKWGPLLFGSS